jgi:hypothetical protein
VHVTTVEDLHTSPRLPSPTLLVVGEVVRLAKPDALRQQFAAPNDSVHFASGDPIWSVGRERAE